MPETGGASDCVEFLDPEMLMEGIRDSHLMPCQLSSRPAPSRIARLTGSRIGLDLVSLGPAMLFSGAMPKERFTLTYVVECPGVGVSFNFGVRHTDGYLATGGKTAEARWLTGGRVGWQGAWGTTYATNLRLTVPHMTTQEWLRFARQPRRPPR